MLDAAHDPFVGREETSLGVLRRSLYGLCAQLERQRPGTARRIELLEDGSPSGTLELGPAGVALPDAVDPSRAADELAHALHTWAATHVRGLRLTDSPATPTAAEGTHVTVAEAFARAGALSEPSREGDAASELFSRHVSDGQAAVLVRLRERSELLPYPVAAQGLGALRLRGLVNLCHAAARLVRPPGWQSASRAQLSWGVLRLPERTFAVVPGDTHIALLSAPEAELDALFLSVSAAPPKRSGAPDAR